MRPALLLISLSLAAFLTADVLVQEPVESQFQTDLVLVDPVAGVSLFVPSVAVEGTNVSLRCTWTAGTDISVQWGKDDSAIIADSRITILEGLLVISPARRSDTGRYTCTVSNPVSAETASESLRIYYGPDTPVITKDTPKECVGGGDARVGQTVRLNCMADSLPPALFSWQGNGVPLPSDQPDSGVLSLETVSTSESGEYICTARNIITGGVSDQRTDLAIVDTCLDVGEVVGIVIGCLLLLIIIVLLILLIVCLVQRRRRVTERQRGRDGVVVVQKTNPNPRPLPPVPQTNGARDLGQGPPPPLYLNTRARERDRLHLAPRERQSLQLNSMHNTQHHNGHTHTNGVQHNAAHNTNSYPHNGIDNPAFTHADTQNARTNTQQQNPNIVIQTGAAQGSNQPPAVQVSLNMLPQTAQQNDSAQMPTIHVNLNSYSTNGQQTQDNSFPVTSVVNNNASQIPTDRVQSNPRMQSGQSYPTNTQMNGDMGHQAQPDLIPTGYTHHNRNNSAQRNANTQTYQQDPESHSRSDRRRDAAANSSSRQMPWDRLRGTPAYPSGRQTSPEIFSDATDYTTHPPLDHARTSNRSLPQSQNTSQTGAVSRQAGPPLDRHAGHSAYNRGSYTLRVPQLEPAHHSHRNPSTQTERAQQDIRGPPARQPALRQEATHSSNPQALPLMSQQASAGPSAESQGLMSQQGVSALQGADTRTLADPNHLPQGHMAQQHRAAPSQTKPQGLAVQTAIHSASQPRQQGTAPVPYTAAQPTPSNLTEAALQAHTVRAQTFQNRRQQTQAALLHPGPQPRAPAAEAARPPTPPPAIPLTQFQTLPKERTQHRSPTRGPQPPRPPVNIPVAQRPLQVRQNPHVHHQPTAIHASHHPRNVHATAHRHAHIHNHRHPAHVAHRQQQQAHVGRPRR